jgi:pyruvate/2-oxoglutarate dehydrogenase complex dihydrolipoamide dehydrogenase (E3) component
LSWTENGSFVFAADLVQLGPLRVVQGAERICPRCDEQASATLHAALEEDDGIEIVLSSTVSSVRPDGDEIVAVVGSREIRVAKLLLASGRAPNVEALRLDDNGKYDEAIRMG